MGLKPDPTTGICLSSVLKKRLHRLSVKERTVFHYAAITESTLGQAQERGLDTPEGKVLLVSALATALRAGEYAAAEVLETGGSWDEALDAAREVVDCLKVGG